MIEGREEEKSSTCTEMSQNVNTEVGRHGIMCNHTGLDYRISHKIISK